MSSSPEPDRVGLDEAKTNLSALVDRVRETRSAVTLTRRGEAVAVLQPVAEDAEARRQKRIRMLGEAAVRHAAERAAGVPRGTAEEIRSDMEERRR